MNAAQPTSGIGAIRSRQVVKASKEIILSAGSVGTPHLLLHSGIGDRKALSALGIKTAHHLPSVGQNFTEQSIAILQWLVNDNNTTDRFTQNATLMAELLDEWKFKGSGPLTSTTTTQIGFLRLPNDSAIFDTITDPSAGVNTPHIELSFSVCSRDSDTQFWHITQCRYLEWLPHSCAYRQRSRCTLLCRYPLVA